MCGDKVQEWQAALFIERAYIRSYTSVLCDSSVSLVMNLLISCLGNINLAADILKRVCGRGVRDLHLPCRFSLHLLCVQSVEPAQT